MVAHLHRVEIDQWVNLEVAHAVQQLVNSGCFDVGAAVQTVLPAQVPAQKGWVGEEGEQAQQGGVAWCWPVQAAAPQFTHLEK